MKQLSSFALAALNKVKIAGLNVTIEETLDRKLYLEVNKALEALGGKWNRAKKCHVFSGIPHTPQKLIEDVLAAQGYVDRKKDLGQFFTPNDVADLLVRLADVKPRHRVLEPSAGSGALLKALHRAEGGPVFSSYFEVYAVEIDRQNADAIKRDAQTFPCVSIYTADFLKMKPNGAGFDRIIMNPPFAKGAAVDHVMHAWDFLAPGGRLAAILPSGITFRSDKKHEEFFEFVGNYSVLRSVGREFSASIGGFGATLDYPFIALPDRAFAGSGTNVSTVIIVLEKPR